MKHLWVLAALLTVSAAQAERLPYPATRTVDVKDTFHGVEVADPYRWMEEMTSPEIHSWVEAQNKLTESQLAKYPLREKIRKRLTGLWNYERYSAPRQRGKRFFYFYNSGLLNQSMYLTSDDLRKPGKLLIDPNTLTTDGTAALNNTVTSPSGRYLAYSISRSGSDWLEWKIRDTETGKDLADSVLRSKHLDVAWMGDESGFYYLKFEESGVNRVYYHRLNSVQKEDRVVYEHPGDKSDYIEPHTTDDGRFLVLFVNGGSSRDRSIYFADLEKGTDTQIHALQEAPRAQFALVGNIGSKLIFKTSLGAPRGRVVAIDTTKTPYTFDTLVAESANDTLDSVVLQQSHLIVASTQDGHARLRVFKTDGSGARDIPLPVPLASLYQLVGETTAAQTFFLLSGPTSPSAAYSLDPASGKVTPVWKLKLSFDPARFTAKHVEYPSKDGTMIPMTIAYRKDLKFDGSAPAILYGYGGFNVVISPWFRPATIEWLELGGIYAWANIRGGGERGETWHQAGIKTHKQTVFDDFMAAAEWLAAQKYTSSKRLAISGASNGGLLVGACLVQRPELFGAALPDVGVHDMLRFQHFTEGKEWTVDYGEIEKADEFKALYAYSPYHNVKPANYPPTLVTTAETDDRVVPAHSFKFAARLQAAQKGEAPILLRVETKAGHGAGTPTSKLIGELTDQLSFLGLAFKLR